MNDYIEILEYNYNNKNFIAYIKNKKIGFGVINNENIYPITDDNEKRIIKVIYNWIVGDKTYLKVLSPIKIKNSIVEVLYNTQNGLYSFYKKNEKGIDILDINLIQRLNFVFNNQEGILYEDKNKTKDKNKFFKVLAKIEGVSIIVIVSAMLAISTLPTVPDTKVMFDIDYKLDAFRINNSNKDKESDYSFEEIAKIINENPNLTEDEKEFLMGVNTELIENIDYIDIDQVKQNLSELRIEYNSSMDDIAKKYKMLPNISYPSLGTYSYVGTDKNLIQLYGTFFYVTDDFHNCDKSTLVHEINHALNKRSVIAVPPGELGDMLNNSIGVIKTEESYLAEMINELFSREYLETYTDQELVGGYDWLMPAMYGLCEILDEDTLRKYKFNSDNFYITDNLQKIGVESDYIFDLYKDIDFIEELRIIANSKDATEQDKENYEENYRQIYNIIKYCYEKKYSRKMENDLIMMAYFYNTNYVDENFNRRFEQLLGVQKIEGVIPRGYVSSDYKEKHQGVEIIIDSELGKTIIINDANRYVEEKLQDDEAER